MQKGKNPTREQKLLLGKKNLDAKTWLYIKDNGDSLVFRNRVTGETITLDKKA